MEIIGWILVIILITVVGLRADKIGKQLTSIDRKLSEMIELLKKNE